MHDMMARIAQQEVARLQQFPASTLERLLRQSPWETLLPDEMPGRGYDWDRG